MIAEVIVDLAHSQVDKLFEYKTANLSVEQGSRVKVPFGGRMINGYVYALRQESEYPLDKLKDIAEVFDEPPALTKESLWLIGQICGRYKCTAASAARLFLPSEMRRGTAREIYIRYVRLAVSKAEALEKISKSASAQRAIVEFLDGKQAQYTEIAKAFGGGAAKALIDKGILEAEKKRSLRSPYTDLNCLPQEKTLTLEQIAAINSISGSKKPVHLIHGVTGSGKTEVYIRLIKQTTESGKSAIFLVPEISLTPKTLLELRAHFGDKAAILHSGLSAGERFDEWQRLRNKSALIAVGARSAVFAPLENIGLIVMDEEHDGSYESESSPRYSTFEIAKLRAGYNGCKLILGSATPSIESYMHACSGEFNLIEMPTRINKSPMPEFIIADMRVEARRGNSGAFSTALKDRLEQAVNLGNQAIIFLNRRGFAKHIVCSSCGYIANCTDCDITLTYHSHDNELKCHYCAKRYKMLKACPECGGQKILYMGTGTQRIVSELQKLLPSARIARMDNDTTSGKEGHYKILKSFADKEFDILVGTQMVAKGHDFPAVTLVGILDADMSLNFPDYRSRERTFQLLTQVAGRSGRGDEKGVVVLQTYNPDNEIIKYAINYDYKAFYTREIALRKALSYPPYSTILRVMVVSRDREKAVAALKEVYFSLESLYNKHRDSFVFFNKMNSPLKRLENKHRMQVLMILKDDNLIDEIYNRSLKVRDNSALVYVEENPGNLS